MIRLALPASSGPMFGVNPEAEPASIEGSPPLDLKQLEDQVRDRHLMFKTFACAYTPTMPVVTVYWTIIALISWLHT